MKLTALILLAFATSTSFASVQTDTAFDKSLTRNKITPKEQQAYCYTDKKGKVQGVNIDLQVRLASVSKLITSLWAIEVKGVNYRYDTKLFIKGKNLHIQGSFDPFMSNEKMYFLVSQLNALGYNHFDTITYDKNVQIYPEAQLHTNSYPIITKDTNGKYINLFFNTASWSKVFKNEYDRVSNNAKRGRYLRSVNFSVDNVEFSEKNPFITADKSPKDVRVLTLTSPELYKYLKETNVKSNNYSSHTIYRDLGGEAKFEKFMADRFGLTKDKIKLFTGSGLPVSVEGVRKDNYATCAIITDLVAALRDSAERQGKDLEDIVAVPGNDLGTFRRRLNSSDYRNTFVAKTGTLVHTSALAGALSTRNGVSFFGVFNQTSNISAAKSTQDEMVAVLFKELGGPKNFSYRVEGFHAYDNKESVKGFGMDDLDEEDETDFTAVDSDLF